MRVATTKANKVKVGDQIVVTVSRVKGMQGRKPTDGRAPLMRVEFDDGTECVMREDSQVRLIRD